MQIYETQQKIFLYLEVVKITF